VKRIVVSPHLDDAVLSCGGQLGPETTAVTVFAGTPPPGTSLPRWDRLTGASDPLGQVLLRRSEDAEALDLLGATYRHLDFLDGQYRDGGVDARELAAALRDEVTSDVDEVWIPAAIGDHPDHVIAREAGLIVGWQLQISVTMYADLPYAMAWGWPPFAETETASHQIRRREEELAHRLAQAGWRPTAVTTSLSRLDAKTAVRKFRASRCYRSQLPLLDKYAQGRLTDREAASYELTWRLGSVQPLPGRQ
jgi:LmbE family N-acetylglucosaminyl deacetylase